MTRYAFVRRRLLHLVPVILGVTLLTFLMIHLVPGDPARAMLGNRANPQNVAALHREWGLDQPLPQQYLSYMGRLARGDLGESLVFRVPVTQLATERLPATLWLLGYATALAVLLTVPLATLAATRKDRFWDQVVRVVPMVGLGMPAFWVGILLILLLALTVPLFPVGGYGEGFLGHLRAVFLPALTIALSLSPLLIRSLRASMVEVLESEYVTTAHSKGLAGPRLLLRHVLPNAAIPTVTLLGVNIGWLVGGTLVVENVFALPGIGNLMLTGILNRDFPVVQGVALVFAVLVVGVNLLTDVVYAVLDPRVRFD